jgi:hypothetical protein
VTVGRHWAAVWGGKCDFGALGDDMVESGGGGVGRLGVGGGGLGVIGGGSCLGEGGYSEEIRLGSGGHDRLAVGGEGLAVDGGVCEVAVRDWVAVDLEHWGVLRSDG